MCEVCVCVGGGGVFNYLNVLFSESIYFRWLLNFKIKMKEAGAAGFLHSCLLVCLNPRAIGPLGAYVIQMLEFILFPR